MIKVKAVFTGDFWKKRDKIIIEEFGRAMDASLNLLERNISHLTPVGATGHLRQQIVGKKISPFFGRVGTQGSAARYDYYAEFGRKPGKMPPYDAIEYYVRRKIRPHVLASSRTTRRTTKQLKKVGPRGGNPRQNAINSVTYLLRRKIAKFGTKGAFMFQRGEAQSRRQVDRNFEEAVRKAEKRLSDVGRS